MLNLRGGDEANMSGDNTFIRITNKMIYEKLELIETKLSKIKTKVNVNHAVIGVIILILVAIISRIV